MENVGQITISDLSKAYYIYYKSRYSEKINKEEIQNALEIIGNAPKEVKTKFETIRKRKQRLRRRLSRLFEEEDSLYFLTLNYSDDYIDNYIYYINKFKRQLKTENIRFIINEDFGDEVNYTGRVHFHCIINKRIKVLNYWPVGGFKLKKVKICDSSLRKIPDYFNKLVNHALKESNKRIKVYYNL